MKFSDFKSVRQVLQIYPLAIQKEQFISGIELRLPDMFINELNFSLKMQSDIENEMFYREYFIAPFIRQAWMNHPNLKVWVNQYLAYNDELTGEPDYFISQQVTGVTNDLIGKPLLAVVEAKQEKFKEGWGQCLAGMIACQKLNATDDVVIYGVVTTGELWQFAKLTGDVFTRNLLSYSINDPEKIFGIVSDKVLRDYS
ncbi:MAG: hypothetical protein B6242_09895 [Anaerolineaceae bacterium 4572_78]|nr:MAG: hypothetical protein B6242_09895 [Anaerolineaceae bacterium 4572_78]